MFVRTLSTARTRGSPLADAATARAVALDDLDGALSRRVIAYAERVGMRGVACAGGVDAGGVELAGSLAQFAAAAAVDGADRDLAPVFRAALDALRRALSPPRVLRAGPFAIDLSSAIVMGILNVAKESFYDGGRYLGVERALARASEMLDEGARIIDVGGQSYNAKTPPVDEAEEIARVVPVVEALARAFPGVPLSVDTVRSGVARAALEAGAAIVNDCSGNADPQMAAVCARYAAGDVVMHLKGRLKVREPERYVYRDVAAEIVRFLHARTEAARAAGVAAESIVVDPGLEFGKEPADDLTILARLEELRTLGYPLLLAASRKSFMGRLFSLPAGELLAPSAAAAAAGALAGVQIIRAHDVQFTVRLVRMLEAIASGPCATGDI
ncbi:MAG: dihydropteroate synthase [bacterium]|nr:dihydropteroate synthase [bacterium]